MTTEALTVPDKQDVSALPVLAGPAMVQALLAYKELQRALDASMPDQLMELDGRAFRKKGYWRAVEVAFQLHVECVSETREVYGMFEDGRDNFGYLVTYQAADRHGRAVPGDGACFAVEKAAKFRCPHPHPTRRGKTEHWPAETCPAFDPGYHWRAQPRQATEHNIRSHAHTRAFNRAVSNLVGFGEVSAEEVDRKEHEEEDTLRPEERREGREPLRRPERPPRQQAGFAAETRPPDIPTPVHDPTLPPLPEGTVRLLGLTEQHGKTTSGTPYTRFLIKDSTGRTSATFHKSVAALAAQCIEEKAPVYVTVSSGKFGLNLDELVRWAPEPALSATEDAALDHIGAVETTPSMTVVEPREPDGSETVDVLTSELPPLRTLND